MLNIEFPNGWDDRTEFEAESRGYYGDVIVDLGGGVKYRLCFYDPVRIDQDLARIGEYGESCIAEAGLVIVPAVNSRNIKQAILELHKKRYFETMVPLP